LQAKLTKLDDELSASTDTIVNLKSRMSVCDTSLSNQRIQLHYSTNEVDRLRLLSEAAVDAQVVERNNVDKLQSKLHQQQCHYNQQQHNQQQQQERSLYNLQDKLDSRDNNLRNCEDTLRKVRVEKNHLVLEADDLHGRLQHFNNLQRNHLSCISCLEESLVSSSSEIGRLNDIIESFRQ
jgi:multidrug resistance efflux pump